MSLSLQDSMTSAILGTTSDAIATLWGFRAATDVRVINVTRFPSIKLASGSDYVVTGGGAKAGGGYDTGTVTLQGTASVTVGDTILILRDTQFTQAADYQTSGPFPADTHENALDVLTMIAQDNYRRCNYFTHTVSIGALGANLTAGADQGRWVVPFEKGFIVDIAADLRVAGSTLTTIDINRTANSILSTKLTIDANERSSITAAARLVLDATYLAALGVVGKVTQGGVTQPDTFTIDLDGVGTGAQGLDVHFTGIAQQTFDWQAVVN